MWSVKRLTALFVLVTELSKEFGFTAGMLKGALAEGKKGKNSEEND